MKTLHLEEKPPIIAIDGEGALPFLRRWLRACGRWNESIHGREDEYGRLMSRIRDRRGNVLLFVNRVEGGEVRKCGAVCVYQKAEPLLPVIDKLIEEVGILKALEED